MIFFFNWLKISCLVHILMLEHVFFMRIGHTMHNLIGGRFGGTTFTVPGSKQNHLLPELVSGSKTTVSARNFTFSVHVDI